MRIQGKIQRSQYVSEMSTCQCPLALKAVIISLMFCWLVNYYYFCLSWIQQMLKLFMVLRSCALERPND
jgi:hypothetical protein